MAWRAWWLVAGLAAGLAAAPVARAQEVHLRIIALNDFHGFLQSPGTFRSNAQSPEVPVGGADYLAAYIADLKRGNPLNVVVSAGDLTGASPLVSALFHDEDTIEAMNRMGLEINGVGNHEFDGGKRELLRKQHGGCWNNGAADGGCKGGQTSTFRGAKFQYLAANVYDTATGKTIFPGYTIRAYGGVRVAFIGLTLKDTPAIATQSAMTGLRFADEAETINAIVRRLRGKGVESFVVLVHQGGFQKGNTGVDINACAGGLAGSPIEAIVNRLDDAVGLVLSAHTHAAYVCEVANRTGRRIPVTSASAFGRMITDIAVTLDRGTQRVTHVAARNVLVDRMNPEIAPDAAMKAMVDGFAARSAPLTNRVVGTIGAEILKPDNDAGEGEMGDLIADAQLEATRDAAHGGAVIALMNSGGVRAGLVYDSGIAGVAPGKVTYGELYEAQPFGNELVTMTLTGAQIKTLLEEQFKGCGIGVSGEPRITQRWLEVSAGFYYSWSASAPTCEKIDANSIKLNGTVLDPAAKYRVTMNSLLAGGGEQFDVLKQGTDRRTGVADLEAMELYFAKHAVVVPPQGQRIRQTP